MLQSRKSGKFLPGSGVGVGWRVGVEFRLVVLDLDSNQQGYNGVSECSSL